MHIKRSASILFAPIVGIFLGLSTVAIPANVLCEEVKLEVVDPSAIKAGLEKLVGKVVALRLQSGEELGGTVEAVGPAAVRLGQLTGKDFYSAIVKLDDISAVIYRAK